MRRSASEFHGRTTEAAHMFLDHKLSANAVTKGDYDLILRFLSYKLSFDDIKDTRYYKLCQHLVWWRRYLPEFTACTLDDIILGVGKLKKAKTIKGDLFSNNVVRDYISVLKMLFSWMEKNNLTEIRSSDIREIKLPARKNKKEITIFKNGDIEKLIEASKRVRDKAMIGLLYEGGFRIGEIGTMVWGQILFDEWGIVVKEDFKTGKKRTLRLATCKQDLIYWRNEYKKFGEPYGDSPIFLNEKKEPYNYRAIIKHLQRLALRADIKTKFTPHSFRHTRITDLKREGISDAVIGLMMWGDAAAPELGTYNQMNFDDVNNTMLQHYGISSPAVQHEKILPRQCPKCHEINPPRFSFCGLCGEPLDQKAIDSLEAAKTNLSNDDELQYEKFKKWTLRMKEEGISL